METLPLRPYERPSEYVEHNNKTTNRKWHSNVYRMFIFRLVSGVAYAVRSTSIYDNYIRMQFGDNKTVGFMSLSSGIALLLAAAAIGPLCDRYRNHRSRMLRLISMFGICCTAINYFGLRLDSLPLLLTSSFCWAFWFESVFVVSDALFADSLEDSQRSEAFVYRRMIATLSRGLGPIASLLLFTYFGNKWDIEIVHFVLQTGLLLSILQIATLWNWEDVPNVERTNITSKIKGNVMLKNSVGGITINAIPWIIFVSGKIKSLGAGLTVNYFSLFFIEEYGFLPVHICLLSATYSVCIVAATYVLFKISARVGRIKAAFYTSVAATCLLFIFSFSHNLPLVIVLYLIRGALQNGPSPLTKSLLMEIIEPAHRGKWLSLESLSNVTWNGSALLGGFISDVKNYRYCFVVTGVFYIISNLVYFPCLWLIEDAPPPPLKRKLEGVDVDVEEPFISINGEAVDTMSNRFVHQRTSTLKSNRNE